MTEDTDDYHIPEDEEEVVERLEAERGRELTEQERNLAIAQAP
jgi:hypothetical protein